MSDTTELERQHYCFPDSLFANLYIMINITYYRNVFRYDIFVILSILHLNAHIIVYCQIGACDLSFCVSPNTLCRKKNPLPPVMVGTSTPPHIHYKWGSNYVWHCHHGHALWTESHFSPGWLWRKRLTPVSDQGDTSKRLAARRLTPRAHVKSRINIVWKKTKLPNTSEGLVRKAIVAGNTRRRGIVPWPFTLTYL